MTIKLLLSGTAITLGIMLIATPSFAQSRCDLNGVAGVPLVAQGTNSIVCGTVIAAASTADDLTALGAGLAFSGDGVTVVGAGSIADTAISPFAIANYTRPDQFGATVIGAYAIASGPGSVAIGDQATIGVMDFATGYSPIASVGGGTAVGSHAFVGGNGGTSIGFAAQVNAPLTTAVGSFAVADANAAVALGVFTDATGAGAIAIGGDANGDQTGAQALAASAIALGADSRASTAGAIAIGANAIANGTGGVAIGLGASNAAFANSVAIGGGSVNTAASQVYVGGRTIGGVANGVAATDAVNVSQLNSATASLNSSIVGLQNNIVGLQGDVDTLYDITARDRREARRGTAAAVAMSEAPMPSRDGGISYSVHGASYRGEFAVGGSLKYRISGGGAFDIGVSHAGGKDTAVRAGVSGEF